MNYIEAKIDKSDYNDDGGFLNYHIDNYWMDEKLDELYPDNFYKGLIPTLLCGLIDKEEEIVWSSIFPHTGAVNVCPILMCPDDYDFSCTLIVAEIENDGSCIQWKKVGVDNKTKWFDNQIMYDIKWFDDFKTLNFEIENYSQMVDVFKKQYQIDLKKK